LNWKVHALTRVKARQTASFGDSTPPAFYIFPEKIYLTLRNSFRGKMAQTAIIAMGVIWYGTLEIPDTQVDYMN